VLLFVVVLGQFRSAKLEGGSVKLSSWEFINERDNSEELLVTCRIVYFIAFLTISY